MPTDLAIRCNCGAVQGVARNMSPRAGTRVICYCDDCQAYAAYLGSPEGMLDEWGGTDVFGTSPVNVELTAGTDRLACIHFTPNGPLRWYAGCCKCPIANTGPPRIPHVGLIHSCLRPEGQTLDDVLGPVDMRIMVRFAKGNPGNWENAHQGFGIGPVVSVIASIIGRRLLGHHKHSPFIDQKTGRPIVAPIKRYE